MDLLTAGEEDEACCVGALFFNVRRGALEVFRAGAVILATGGCGQVYRVTTNPIIATGDGLAAAWRAGADITDLEFVQFHPTAFVSRAEPKFLITEALRGEGAYLLDCEQRRFMKGVHPLEDLAPRDVVAREIEKTMARSRRPSVFLDARHLGAEFLRRRFRTIWKTCSAAGCDISRDLIPVVPAAHYTIGGVRVDINGRTSLKGLFASGEVIASGLHGANRLASNSLLEGLVFSRRIARALVEEAPALLSDRVISVSRGCLTAKLVVRRAALQGMMSEYVGLTRSDTSVSQACDRLAEMGEALAGTTGRAPRDFELQNLVTVAALVTHAARHRIESRGTHYRKDYPTPNDEIWRVHAVWRRDTATRLVPA